MWIYVNIGTLLKVLQYKLSVCDLNWNLSFFLSWISSRSHLPFLSLSLSLWRLALSLGMFGSPLVRFFFFFFYHFSYRRYVCCLISACIVSSALFEFFSHHLGFLVLLPAFSLWSETSMYGVQRKKRENTDLMDWRRNTSPLDVLSFHLTLPKFDHLDHKDDPESICTSFFRGADGMGEANSIFVNHIDWWSWQWQHRLLLRQACPRSYQIGFVPYSPMMHRKYLELKRLGSRDNLVETRTCENSDTPNRVQTTPKY